MDFGSLLVMKMYEHASRTLLTNWAVMNLILQFLRYDIAGDAAPKLYSVFSSGSGSGVCASACMHALYQSCLSEYTWRLSKVLGGHRMPKSKLNDCN